MPKVNSKIAREIVLDAVTEDLFEEHMEQVADLQGTPDFTEVDRIAYDVLVANKDKHVVTHILDFTEEEVADSVRKHAVALVDELVQKHR